MKNLKPAFVNFCIVTLLVAACQPVNAQNLPNVQTVSVLAPPDVKTDGKTNEWGNQFEAYNKTLGIYYTMANDDSKLYLIIQATNVKTVAKILWGGIVFTIKSNDNTGKSIALTYPLLKDKIKLDTNLTAIGVQLAAGEKGIGVKGISGVADSIMAITNNIGMRAAELISYPKVYTYELAIPLQNVAPFLNSMLTFSYNIAINEDLPMPVTTKPGFSGRYTLAL